MMRRVELQGLLPAGTVSDRSQADVLQGLTSVTSGSGAATDVGSLLQGPVKDVTGQLAALSSQITTLNSTQQAQIGVTQDNTQAITQNSSAKSGGSSVGSTVGSVASSVLGSGLSLSPIISGLMSLFGGGDSPIVSPPAPFQLPTSVQYTAGLSAGSPGQAVPVSFDAAGQPRPQPSSPAAPQVTVQVNAIDSRSFLDHSDEIASAVRQALLSSNSLSDIISDL